MQAMALTRTAPITADSRPLELLELPAPEPAAGEVLLRVRACGVCHTELDEIEGRLTPAQLPRVLGHQVVGEVVALGEGAARLRPGERVGVGWIGSACGECDFCRTDRENLCPDYRGTGYDIDGGYAEQMVVDEGFAHPIPESLTDTQAAPLLCAGAIGYRSLRMANMENGRRLGLTGFGASAHLVLHMARHRFPDVEVYVFARDPKSRQFALELGAAWAGGTGEAPPYPLDAIIDTTPAWLPVLAAMERLAPGGRLVINAIRKEAGDQRALQSLDYPLHLWREKEIKSVANVTRRDIREFLQLAADMRLQPEVQTFALADANRALVELKTRQVRGAKVLVVD